MDIEVAKFNSKKTSKILNQKFSENSLYLIFKQRDLMNEYLYIKKTVFTSNQIKTIKIDC